MRVLKLVITLVVILLSNQVGNCQIQVKNKDVIIRYFDEVVNKRKVDLLHEIFTDSFLVHNLTDSTQKYSTLESQKKFLLYLFKAFPDIHYSIGDLIEEGNKVVLRTSLSATHKNEFWGYKGSGNRIRYSSTIRDSSGVDIPVA